MTGTEGEMSRSQSLGYGIATRSGLGLAVLQRQLWARLAGAVLIALPHIIGAPTLQHRQALCQRSLLPSSPSHRW